MSRQQEKHYTKHKSSVVGAFIAIWFVGLGLMIAGDIYMSSTEFIEVEYDGGGRHGKGKP